MKPYEVATIATAAGSVLPLYVKSASLLVHVLHLHKSYLVTTFDPYVFVKHHTCMHKLLIYYEQHVRIVPVCMDDLGLCIEADL